MNDKITYKEKHQIKSSEVSSNRLLSISSLLKMIQDLSTSGAEYINIGKDKTTDKGYLWVLTKLEININRLPNYREEVLLTTFPNQMVHFIYPRTYTIYDLNNNPLVEIKSLWVLIDINTRKVLLPKDTCVTQDFISTKMDKIDPVIVERVRLVDKRTVKYSDIDLNKHLNNTKYFDYIFDLYDSSFNDNRTIKKINIIFHQEAKENDVLDILKSDEDNYYVIEKDSKKIFECNIE